jgi:hypothetical protein
MYLSKVISNLVIFFFTVIPFQFVSRDTDLLQIKSFLSTAEKSPHLTIDYSKTVRFKLASHKPTYRVGELLALDLALLNEKDDLIFTSIPASPNLYFRRQSGLDLLVTPYIITRSSITIDSFKLLKRDQWVSHSILLLIGCKNESFLAKKDELEDRQYFEQNKFVNRGEGCIGISQLGEYTLTAELSNAYVVISPDNKTVKTTVGVIKSEPLTITVIE